MKATKQNQIQDYLQLSSDEYEQMVLTHYWSWCQKYSTNEQMLQCYLSNATINNYFMTEWNKNENIFLKMIEGIPKTPDRLAYHYNGCVVQIYKNHSPGMFEKFRPKKQQEVPHSLRINQFIAYAN